MTNVTPYTAGNFSRKLLTKVGLKTVIAKAIILCFFDVLSKDILRSLLTLERENYYRSRRRAEIQEINFSV